MLITNVSVWDGTSDTLNQGADVLVVGNKVEKIGAGLQPTYTFTMEDEEGNKTEKNVQAHVVNGQGGTVTPGLIDMHQHLNLNGGTSAGTHDWDAYVVGAHASRAAEYLLRSGFTTIRDIAGNSLVAVNPDGTEKWRVAIGTDFDSCCHNWATQGLNYYVCAKLHWNPDLDVDALIDEVIAATGAESIRDMGKVMGAIKARAAGRADMGTVGSRVKARLGA